MAKKLLLLIVQVMAFAGIMSVVSAYVNTADWWKLLIFGTILLGITGGSNIAVMSILEQRKKNKRSDEKVNEDDKNTPE